MSDSGRHGSSPNSDSGDPPRLPPGTHEALRFAGAGMELGGSAIACAVIGYAIDRYLQNETMIATALGAILGFAGGLFRFIRLALAASRDSNRADK
ncbi:MAG TPA: hypothetical protein DDZ51_16625 [Planctomycetaceae bacterium]|nr:hypothetical protein [Planctomycetaceae bacterium]